MINFKEVNYNITNLPQERRDKLPKNLKSYTYEAFPINVLKTEPVGTNVSYLLNIDNTIERFSNIRNILSILIKVYPFDMKSLITLMENLCFTNMELYDFDEIFDKSYQTMVTKDSYSIFFHNDIWRVLKSLGYNNNDSRVMVDNYISNRLTIVVNNMTAKFRLKSILREWYNEINTITDTRFRIILNEPYMKGIVHLLIIDHILEASSLKDISDYRNILFALSRDMFYDAKMHDVLSILEMNKGKFGILGLSAINLIEEDVKGNQVRRFTTRMNYFDNSSQFHKKDFNRALENILVNTLRVDSGFESRTFGESLPVSEMKFSQATGLQLSTTSPIGQMKPLEAGVVDSMPVKFEVDNDVLRTMNYRKIASKIEQLEEETLFIKDIEAKEKALNDSKYILDEISNNIKMDENNFPELEILRNKVHEIIADIHSKEYDSDPFQPSSEGLVGDTVKGAMKIPTAVFDAITSVIDFRRSKQPKKSSQFLAWCRLYFDKISKVLDYIVGATIPVPIVSINRKVRNSDRMTNMVNSYKRKRIERGYMQDYGNIAKHESFDLNQKFVDFTEVYVSSEGLVSSVKNSTNKIVKSAKTTWRILAIQKTFSELKITINFLVNKTSEDGYKIKRLAYDHLEQWEDTLDNLNEDDPHDKKIINKINSEIKKMKSLLSNIKDVTGKKESYNLEDVENDPKDYTPEEIEENPTPIVEEMIENEEESEEKDEVVKQLEEHILEKLKKSGAIPEEARGESFLDLLLAPFNKKLSNELEIVLLDLEKKLAFEKNEKKKMKLQEMKAAIKMKIEEGKLKSWKDFKFEGKKNVPYLVFHRGKTEFGKLISLFTFCPFSHVDILINGDVYTADGDGIVKKKLLGWNEVVIYELSPEVDYKKILNYFRTTFGRPYGYSRLLKAQILKRSTPTDKEKLDAFFCSHWVASAIDKSTNLNLHFRGKPIEKLGYDYFSPKLLFNFIMNCKGLVKSTNSLTEKAEKRVDENEHSKRSEG